MRLIDADALCGGLVSNHPVAIHVKNAPTVDAVEVVRCVDCKWISKTDVSGTIEPIMYRCKMKRIFVQYDDYCKYGEKRNDGDNR